MYIGVYIANKLRLYLLRIGTITFLYSLYDVNTLRKYNIWYDGHSVINICQVYIIYLGIPHMR